MWLITNNTQIPATDDALDRIAALLEHPPDGSFGFWVAGHLEGQRNGEPLYPDPTWGHQRMWIPVTQIVTLVYDRALHPNPDRIDESTNIVYIGN